MHTHVAFLRGINVGGHKKVPMVELKELFAALGYQRVKTLLASGNVLFATESQDEQALEREIEQALEEKFSFAVPVLIRPLPELRALVERKPFADVSVKQSTRLYVTFLPSGRGANTLPRPQPVNYIQILEANEREVLSVLDVTNSRSVDLMTVLEQTYGKNITTRNWNTVERLVSSAA